MKRIIKTYSFPHNSKLHFYCKTIDYCDSYGIHSDQKIPIEDITQKIFSTPSWAIRLLKMRDFIVKPFGLHTSDQMFEKNKNEAKELENKLPFPLIEKTGNEVVMHEKDKHLNFWVSVMYNKNIVYLTTVVEYNNVWGKIYFAFVKPFHSLIIESTLKNIKD